MQIILKENGIEKKALVESIDFTRNVVSVITGDEIEKRRAAETDRLVEAIRDSLAALRQSEGQDA